MRLLEYTREHNKSDAGKPHVEYRYAYSSSNILGRCGTAPPPTGGGGAGATLGVAKSPGDPPPTPVTGSTGNSDDVGNAVSAPVPGFTTPAVVGAGAGAVGRPVKPPSPVAPAPVAPAPVPSAAGVYTAGPVYCRPLRDESTEYALFMELAP